MFLAVQESRDWVDFISDVGMSLLMSNSNNFLNFDLADFYERNLKNFPKSENMFYDLIDPLHLIKI